MYISDCSVISLTIKFCNYVPILYVYVYVLYINLSKKKLRNKLD